MKKYLALFLALFACHGEPSHSVGSTVIQPAATTSFSGITGGDVTCTSGGNCTVSTVGGALAAVATTGSLPVLGTAGTQISTTSADTSITTTHTLVLNATGATYINGNSVPLLAGGSYALDVTSTGIEFNQPVGGFGSTPFSWSATASAIACGTGGTQTITAAQAITPGLTVTTGTLSSPCILDFSTNASTGFYVVDTSGVGTINVNNLEFKNGTQTQSLGALPAGGAVLVWTHGTNHIVVN